MGTSSCKGVLRDDHPADVLAEMPRKALQFADQSQELANRARARIKTGHATTVVKFDRTVVERFGQRIDSIQRDAECLADIAHGRARSVGDDLGCHGRTVATVLVVDVLQDFFAALMFEIDIDIGRFVAFARDKSLEQHVEPFGIDGGDLQAIADNGIGRRSAALVENSTRTGKASEIPDGQKIGFVMQFLDQVPVRA